MAGKFSGEFIRRQRAIEFGFKNPRSFFFGGGLMRDFQFFFSKFSKLNHGAFCALCALTKPELILIYIAAPLLIRLSQLARPFCPQASIKYVFLRI